MGAALAAAAPSPEPQQLASFAAQLPSLVAELGPLVSAEASQLAPALENLQNLQIPGLSPTAVVSDLPAVLSSELPALETYALAQIPSGLFSPAEMSAISAAAPGIFSSIAQNIDGLIADLPQTLPVTALGPYIASNLPAIESEILADVSSLVPVASSILTAVDAQATGAGSAGTTGGFGPTATGTGFSGALTPTASAPISTFTGAASANGWGKGVVGAAAVVGVVGAML